MQLFYAPAIQDGYHLLDKEESFHCIRVLRMGEGHEVLLTDGRGGMYRSVITAANPRGCMLQVVEKKTHAKTCSGRLHLAVAPTKQIDRFEWFLEKATECGINEITPVICENSERTIIKPERLERVMVSAMKQSLRLWLPNLNPAITLKQFFERESLSTKYIAHCAEGNKNQFHDVYNKGKDAVVLVGPEGDFSPQEIDQATKKGYLPLSLGSHRLRTETAALAICIEFNLLNNI